MKVNILTDKEMEKEERTTQMALTMKANTKTNLEKEKAKKIKMES